MLALEVEYLTGRAVATLRHRREESEWPPHPGRLFSALVAALHESDLTDVERSAARDALLWLEQLSPPAIAVTEAERRVVIPAFVPVNDVETPAPAKDGSFSPGQVREGFGVLPESRPKQPRFF